METLVLRTFDGPVRSPDRRMIYLAKVCGRATPVGRWEGWIEFSPEDGGPVLRSGRETTQPDQRFLEAWAATLGTLFMEGCLKRALEAVTRAVTAPPSPGAAHRPGPAPTASSSSDVPPDDAPLNPVLYFRRGEAELKRKLAELSPAELRTVIRAYALDRDGKVDVDTLSRKALVQLIMLSVPRRAY